VLPLTTLREAIRPGRKLVLVLVELSENAITPDPSWRKVIVSLGELEVSRRPR
jgi:hypothetical protein